MQRFFDKLRMRWLTVILFAVIAGVFTGVMMLIPALKNTSFQNIGINLECWVVFAVIIVTKCDKPAEAMLKCFVFFLISQPLVYLTEIVFGTLTVEKALIYYRQMWLPLTIATLPGGLIAYFCKKQNFGGCLILALGNTILLLMGISYTVQCIAAFPRHLLSAVFCYGSVVALSFGVQEEKRRRILTLGLTVLFAAAVILLLKMSNRYLLDLGNGISFP